MKKKEIFSSCCCFGSDGTEEVHVLMEDCPTKRTETERKRKKYLSVPVGKENPIIHECQCVYFSGFHGMRMIPTCPHYKGTKKVQRQGKKVWKVSCSALENESR